MRNAFRNESGRDALNIVRKICGIASLRNRRGIAPMLSPLVARKKKGKKKERRERT